MATSNTRECFRAFVGMKLVGLLFDALPVGRRDLAEGTKTLVFENGEGLTISSKGTYWTESAEDIRRALALRREELTQAKEDIAEVLRLAGELEMSA